MRWRVPKGVARYDDESAWVLVSDRGVIVRLDAASAIIWEACVGSSDAGDVVAQLAASNGWDPDVIRGHVEPFIDELIAIGLLERSEA